MKKLNRYWLFVFVASVMVISMPLQGFSQSGQTALSQTFATNHIRPTLPEMADNTSQNSSVLPPSQITDQNTSQSSATTPPTADQKDKKDDTDKDRDKTKDKNDSTTQQTVTDHGVCEALILLGSF